ncbi:MAG: ABC transporter ATP-binding protein [Blautia sp.]|nr:ABC transporter ATP-binding protein [Blautia sp.]
MQTLIQTEGLKKYYGKKHVVRAVDDVSLQIMQGRSLALIGESGSGKTTFARLIGGLEKPSAGKVRFLGQEIQGTGEKTFRPLRKDMQIVFQSSGGVFDPGYTIGESIVEVLRNYEKLPRAAYEERVDEALRRVGLDPELKNRYVTQLSGGQCQRANIARALVLRPKLVICDEPVSSLDYSIRKQILNLLNEIQEKYDVTYLLITHDLSNVPYVCKAVAIMYQGRILEYMEGTTAIGERVMHPYSKLLYRSIPAADPRRRRLLLDEPEQTEELHAVPKGCPFQNRCVSCTDRCRETMPPMVEREPGHQVACYC